jgi:hypothetical protein
VSSVAGRAEIQLHHHSTRVQVGDGEADADGDADVVGSELVVELAVAAGEVVSGSVVMEPEAVAVVEAEVPGEAEVFFFALAEADADTAESGSAEVPLVPVGLGEALGLTVVPLALSGESCESAVPVT